jgi:hypothetical protein
MIWSIRKQARIYGVTKTKASMLAMLERQSYGETRNGFWKASVIQHCAQGLNENKMEYRPQAIQLSMVVRKDVTYQTILLDCIQQLANFV